MLSLSRSLVLSLAALTLAVGCDRGPGEGRTAAISSITSPQLMPKCPAGQCIQYTVQNFRCGPSMRASTVLIAGPAQPPSILDTTPDEVARVAKCFKPELVVLDTPYGNSTAYLKALAKAGLNAMVVGSSRMVPNETFTYGPAFWSRASVAERAAAVSSTNPAQKMIRWPLNDVAVQKADDLVAAMSKEEMTSRLLRALPHLVKVEPEPEVEMLVFVPPERLH